tara:strand:+ start:7997 stop:8449 length:453 start_codon:yes stop_codon:yes gene_type:complete
MGEIESRKEFIARMFLLTQEIPEEKRKDLNTMLGFFAIQLRHREMEFAKYAAKRVLKGLASKRILTVRDRTAILDLFEDAFSETDYLFDPVSQSEREEFLIDKSKMAKKPEKNTEGFLRGLRYTDPSNTREVKLKFEDIPHLKETKETKL